MIYAIRECYDVPIKGSANLVEKARTGNWLSGNKFSGSATEDEIKNWISGLELEVL